MKRLLFSLALLLATVGMARADFLFTQGTGTTAVGFDSGHGSASNRCVVANNICAGFVPMDSGGTFLFSSTNAGFVQYATPPAVAQSGTWTVTVSNATPLGQAAMAASSPVVIANNQSTIPVNLTTSAGTAIPLGQAAM